MRIRSITGIAGDLAGRAGEQYRRARGAGHARGADARISDLNSTSRRAFPWRRAWAVRRRPRWRPWWPPTRCCRRRRRRLQLLKFAMEGEIVASGSAHIDNIAPCLFGGLVLTVGIDNPRVKQIPVPHVAALRAGASAHVSGHPRGARHTEDQRQPLRFRLADAPISPASSAAATRTTWT